MLCPCVPGGLHGGSEDGEVQLRRVAVAQVVDVGECALVAGIVIAEGVEEGTEAPEEADLVAGDDGATADKRVEPEVAAFHYLPLVIIDGELRALAGVKGADGSDAVRPFDMAEDKVVLGSSRQGDLLREAVLHGGGLLQVRQGVVEKHEALVGEVRQGAVDVEFYLPSHSVSV